MNVECSKCNSEIDPDNINIKTDLAKCSNCGAVLKVSELAQSSKIIEANPPSGSRIEMSKDAEGNLQITLPKKGFAISVIPQLLFAIFWLGFISFWTWGASQASIIFAMFSIPFWIVGISMIIGIINSINEVQKISLNRSVMNIERIRPIRPKSIAIDLKSIQSIRMKAIKVNPFAMFGNFRRLSKMQSSFGSPVETPAVIAGITTEHFFEDANDAEQEWVTTLLSNLVDQVTKK